MSFTVFQENTTISASEMNNNFYWCGQGNWLPMGGNSLANTNGLYDIGSDTYKWNNVYLNNANLTGSIQKSFSLLTSFEVNSINTQTSRIEFSGLNGDDDKIYYILTKVCSVTNTTDSTIGFNINGDSSTNYTRIFTEFDTVAVTRNFSLNNVTISVGFENNLATAGTHNMFAETFLYGYSNTEKVALSNGIENFLNMYVSKGTRIASVYNNATDTITSLVFYRLGGGIFKTGSSIQIFSRGLA